MLTRSKTSFSLTSSHPNPFYDETDPHVDSESEVRGDGNFDYPGSPRIFGVRRGCRGRPRLNKQPVVRGARGRPRLNRNCLLPSFIGWTHKFHFIVVELFFLKSFSMFC